MGRGNGFVGQFEQGKQTDSRLKQLKRDMWSKLTKHRQCGYRPPIWSSDIITIATIEILCLETIRTTYIATAPSYKSCFDAFAKNEVYI